MDQDQQPLPFEQRGVRHDGEQWGDDPLVRTASGRVCCESELTRTDVEAGCLDDDLDADDADEDLSLIEQLDAGLEIDGDGQDYPI
jgi:hypothetical protein